MSREQVILSINYYNFPLQKLFFVDLSGDGHSDHGEVIPQCCFDLP